MITWQFYSCILNIIRGSLHTRIKFQTYTLFRFLDTDELKMSLRARKGYGAFEKRAPQGPLKIGVKN